MSAIEYGAYHLASTPQLMEPQRSNNFEFVITDLDGIRKPGQDDTTNEVIPNAQEAIRLSVKSAKVPTYSQQAIEYRRGNSVIKIPGVPTFESGSVVVYDLIGIDGKSVLLGWQALCYNAKTDVIGSLEKCKKTCYLLEYNSDYSKVTRQWVMQGCWVSHVTMGDFSMENGNDQRTVEATIEYDRGWPEISDTTEE